MRALGQDRYDLLVSVQADAARRLDANDSVAGRAVESRHGAFFAGFGADPVLDALDGDGGSERRTELRAELANLLAACRRAVARGDDATAAGFTAARLGPRVLRTETAAVAALAALQLLWGDF